MEPRDFRRPSAWNANTAAIPALIVIGLGVLFLLNNLHITVHGHDVVDYWPVILIAIGLVKLVDSSFAAGRTLGGILVGAGAVFLASNLGYLHAPIEDFWPLALIAVGLLMLVNRAWWTGPITRAATRQNRAEPEEGGINLIAIFSGYKRSVATPDFRGGQILSIFGGINLDLRGCGMLGESAVIEIVDIFGGTDIRVPENWIVTVSGFPIFGGFTDRTVQPVPGPEVKRLIVKGVGIFGGVTVRNRSKWDTFTRAFRPDTPQR